MIHHPFSPQEQLHYKPHILLEGVGFQGQTKLKNAKVLCIGAGGLGCPLLMYLTAAGIGTIGIIDFDQVEASNLQRQILFTYDDLEQNKALVAKKRLSLLNPFIEITAHPVRLSIENINELFKNFDIIADCTDNFETRYLINQSCVALNKINVSASVSKFTGQCSVFIPQSGPCYHCLFPNDENQELSCSEGGILGVLPGILGSIQASEIIKCILNLGTAMVGKLLQIDLLNLESKLYTYEQDPECKICVK